MTKHARHLKALAPGIWKLENSARWFLHQGTEKEARKEGRKEFGRSFKIAPATNADVAYYKSTGRDPSKQ